MDTEGNDTQLDDFIASAFERGAEYAAQARGPIRPEVESIGAAKRGSATRAVAEGAARKEKPGGDAPVGNAQVVASPEERENAKGLLARIGKRFAENRKNSKSKAFESYQQDLANNSGTL